MKILMLINTTGLEYDDRLRKEVLSLRSIDVDIEIIALESTNQRRNVSVYNNISAQTLHLRSRGWFRQGGGLPIKTFEMYGQFLKYIWLRRPDVIWFHNLEMTGLVPFLAMLRKSGRVKRLIWDQHELPSDAQLNNPAYMTLFAQLTNLCDAVVMANEQRRDFLQAQSHAKLRTRIEILKNFSDQVFFEQPRVALPEQVQQWLQGDAYFLAQGGASPGRRLHELVTAVLDTPPLKLIVVGPYQQRDLDILNGRYGEQWRKNVLFTGAVPQLSLTPFIDQALASVVLYQMATTNSRLCAPNRLYQAIARAVPVVVGANPPMAELVRRSNCGFVLATDGKQTEDIKQGLREVFTHREEFRGRVKQVQHQMLWDTQAPTIAKLLQ